MKYVAFLRAINVGGRNVIRMDALRSAFESRGFASVSTYLQSGNVLFASEADAGSLTERIETMLKEITGNEISAMLRSLDDLRQIIALDPFAGVEAEDSHRYVTFLRTSSERELPGNTPRGDLEVLRATATEVYSIPHPVGARYGQPGAFVEAGLGVRTTTRNWAVVRETTERLLQ